MGALSTGDPASASNFSAGSRNLSQVILRRLASVKNQTVAAALGRDESYISKLTAGEVGLKLNDLERFLDALDMKCVTKSHVCVEREVHQSYKTLAMKYMQLQQSSAVVEDWDE